MSNLLKLYTKIKMKPWIPSKTFLFFWSVCLIFGLCSFHVQAKDFNDRTLEVLTLRFDQQTVEVQKSVLRQIGLLALDESIPFLSEVALSGSRFSTEVRRDALKTFLALDAQKYRVVLLPLKQEPWDETSVMDAIMLMDLHRTIGGWVRSIDFSENSYLLEKKMIPILSWLEKGNLIGKNDLQVWNLNEAKAYVERKIEQEPQVKTWKLLHKQLGKLN